MDTISDNTSGMTDDPIRAAFEAWHFGGISLSGLREGNGYTDSGVQARWEDWLAACHAARAAAPSEADREWVRHLQSAFADPNDGVVLPHEYFARLCDIALAAPAALEEAAKACDAEVSEIAKTDDNAAIAASPPDAARPENNALEAEKIYVRMYRALTVTERIRVLASEIARIEGIAQRCAARIRALEKK